MQTVKRSTRILILTSNLGHGHTRAAQALRATLLACEPDAEVPIVDWWSLMNPAVAQLAQRLYLDLVQNHPELYERVYHLGERTWRDMLTHHAAPAAMLELFDALAAMSARESLNTLTGPHGSDAVLWAAFNAGGVRTKLAVMKWAWARLSRRMHSLLDTMAPDVVVSTQMIPAALVAKAKQHHATLIPSIAVPTDFGVHDFWIQPGTDLYCLAHESVVGQPDSQRSPLEVTKTRITGLPLMPDFMPPPLVTAARRELRLPTSEPIVLILGGGLGLGVDSIAEYLLRAEVPGRLLVLVARNAVARTRLLELEKVWPQRIQVHDWTERVAVFLRAADVIVGKPGGLSVAESLACGRPFFAVRSLRGQEGFNVRFLERHQVGGLLSEQELVVELRRLLTHPEELRALQARAWAVGERMAAVKIAATVLEYVDDSRVEVEWQPDRHGAGS